MPDGPQQDRIAGLQKIDRSGRHHAAPAKEVLSAPVEILKRKAYLVSLSGMLEDAFGLRDHLGSHTVACNHRDRKGFHWLERQFYRLAPDRTLTQWSPNLCDHIRDPSDWLRHDWSPRRQSADRAGRSHDSGGGREPSVHRGQGPVGALRRADESS